MNSPLTSEALFFSREIKTRNDFHISSTTLIITFSVLVTALYNQTLWFHLFDRMEPISIRGVAFFVGLFSLIVTPIYLLLFVFCGKYLLKPLMMILLIISCGISWFNKLGVIIDENMIRNIVETSRYEAAELVNISMLLYIFFLGVAPCILIYKLRINYDSDPAALAQRSAILIALFLVVGILIISNFKYVSYFGRENRDLRVFINPLYAILSLQKYTRSTFAEDSLFVVIGNDAHRTFRPPKKTVGIFVVGETARADHFLLNGYTKNTTPNLSRKNIINFSNVTSCGTSTAYSVPCMFSFFDADSYSPGAAQNQSNLLDVVQKAGIKTVWRDNNSSCKGVCERIETLNFRSDIDEHSQYFNNGEYVDEILLADLESYIDETQSDVLIVLHQLGSHGPAYHKRYPAKFSTFTPECKSNSPHTCSNEQVNNSYDNTILYTDYFLSKTIELLEKNTGKYQSFMMYSSDHGESLGENGVYLHGLPRSIAPKSQTHVPLIVWLSDKFSKGGGIDYDALKTCQTRPLSHDNLVHSLLSLFNVETDLRDKNLDIFSSACNAELQD